MNGFPALYSGLGFGQDGAFAEYIIATADALVPVVKQGDKVLIFGVGGLGHLAVQYAKHLGATGEGNLYRMTWDSLFAVYVCDFKPAARQLALELGAEMAFDLIELADKTAAGFTVNKTIDFVTNAQTFNLAMAALRGNGLTFPAGVGADNLVFSTFDIIGSGVQSKFLNLWLNY
ncbi:hypothetical protein C8R46DRAFT_1024932 [Mycena filopes]|nr:hypothetical protein C8R46DRAFT_1024932 [Mycena filopes]